MVDACLGEEIDTNGGLVHVVKRVVHEPRNERCLAHCEASASAAVNILYKGPRVDTLARECIPLCSPRNTSLRRCQWLAIAVMTPSLFNRAKSSRIWVAFT